MMIDYWQTATVWLWNVSTGLHFRQLFAHAGKIRGIVWSCGGQKIVSGSADESVRV